MRRLLALPAAALTSVLALAGCASGTTRSGDHPQAGAVRTGFGVTGTDITLGALVDYSGPFADDGIAVLRGQQIWIKDTNATGGVCGRKIRLEIRDGRDDARKATAQYTELEPKVLGFMQIQGSAATTALRRSLLDNETTVIALSNSSELLSNPYVIIPATTYDVEMINGLSALLAQGKIHDGDTIGHIWLDGGYGANALRGVQYFAQRHHLTLRATKVTPESDLRGVVASFAAQPRVRAIALSTTPVQTASAAAANQQLGLNVPMIGNSAAFTPQSLAGPGAGALGNLTVVASSVPFSAAMPQAEHVASAYRQAGYSALPSGGVPYGYATATIWGRLLKRACTNGDLTRSGIQEALRQFTSIGTGNLIADVSFDRPGSPATRQAYVGVPDPATPGGIRQVSPLFESPDAHSYVAPHQVSS